MDDLDDLVTDWLPLPDVADRLGLDVGRVRRLLQDRLLVAVRRGERNVLSVPAALLVHPSAVGAANAPAANGSAAASDGLPGEGGTPAAVPLPDLKGTLTLLADCGYDDAAAVRWLFTPDGTLPGTPVDALREGRKTEVRRRAQALAF